MTWRPETWDVTSSINDSVKGWDWPRYTDLCRLGAYNPADDWAIERAKLLIPEADQYPEIFR